MRSFADTFGRLCEISRRSYVNPYEAIEWPERIADGDLCMSPELVSLHGTTLWQELSEAGRAKLSFYEAVNFFSLNIHGERALLEGLAQRLWVPRLAFASEYLHHFLDEENKHMTWFGTFCSKYAGRPYPEKKLRLERAELGAKEEDFLFFLKVLIFEELVDLYNAKMGKDERLVGVARQINLLHHQDETRHLAFGRMLVGALFEELRPTWSAETLASMRTYAAQYLRATWLEYYNPDVYRDAGIPNPYVVQRDALASEATREHRRRLSAKCVRWLLDIGLFDTEPTP
jgi:hypothetical protein